MISRVGALKTRKKGGGGGGGGGGFSPTSIAGCILWLKADAGVTQSGGAVSQWDDQSGEDNHVAQSTAGRKPTYSASDSEFNNLPSISFDGGDTLFTANSLDYGAQALFLVMKLTANGYIFVHGAVDAADWCYLFSDMNASSQANYGGNTVGKNLAPSWAATASAVSIRQRMDGTVAGNRIAINNSEQSVSNVGANNDFGSATANQPVSIAADNFSVGGEGFSTMKVAEVILYNNDIASVDRDAVEEYLRDKYALY